MKLNTNNISKIPALSGAATVEVPTYDRSQVTQGIVHIGVGGFHRAHLALYMEKLLNAGKASQWGICGVGLRDGDQQISDALTQQDNLYTLFELQQNEDKVQVIGAIGDFILAQQDSAKLIAKLADEETRIVSLTITEGGYCIDDNTGLFNPDLPEVIEDVSNPDSPKTAFGYLALALKLRRDAGIKPFTIMSCDNLPNNGKVTRQVMLSFSALVDPDLSQWIADNVSFPCAMVDRITPATSNDHRAQLLQVSGIDDQWPVVCEPFSQWVIEDDFCNGRPPWEEVGVEFTDNVAAFEEMKIGLLNGSHLAMALLGILSGLEFAHQTMEYKALHNFVRDFMDSDVTPKLTAIPGVNLSTYKDSLIARFANPAICDQLHRIGSDASSKFPKFILPTLLASFEMNRNTDRIALVVAAWIRYLKGADEKGNRYDIPDPKNDLLQTELAKEGSSVQNFLAIEDIFGERAIKAKGFVEAVEIQLVNLKKLGVDKTLQSMGY